MTDDGHSKRRATQRHRVLKGALIVFNDGASTINCTVRNLSETGAHLRVASVVGIPNRFGLQFNDKSPNRNCELVWRKEADLGVRKEAEIGVRFV